MAYGALMAKVLGSALKPSNLPFSYMGGNMVWEMAGNPLWRSASGAGKREMRDFMMEMQDLHMKERQRIAGQREEDRATLRRMAHVTSNLAAVSPQTFNEVLAGERLPQGAVVLGGQPRVDLLQDLAYNLAAPPSRGRFDGF